MKLQGKGTELSSQLTPNPLDQISPTPFMRKTATAPGSPYSCRIARGFFNVPQNYQHSRKRETGPPAYRPYPRRPFADEITKAALSPQLSKEPEW